MRLDMPKTIERIIVLHEHGPMTIHRRRNKRKRSKELKPLAKLARTHARAQLTHAETFLKLHSRSESKRRDGGLRDVHKNAAKANRKHAKVWRKAYK
jgi:hypothetical protein